MAKSASHTTSKTQVIAKLLGRKNGASMAQLQNATGWQAHSIRAAISRLRKKGVTVLLTRSAKGSDVYAIQGERRG